MAAKRPQPKSKPLNKAQLNKLVQMQAEKIQQLEDKIRELEAKIAGKNPTERLEESYSEKADNARKEKAGAKPPARKKSKITRRRGRITTAEKAKLDHRTEQLFPESIDNDLCSFSHTLSGVAARRRQGSLDRAGDLPFPKSIWQDPRRSGAK